MSWRTFWDLVKVTFREWNEDKASRLAAALSYYTIFSIAPLLIIAIAIAGAVFGRAAAEGELFRQLQGLMGQEGAQVIQAAIENAGQPNSGGFLASILNLAILIFAATGLFGQLQESLNTIWEVAPRPGQGVKSFARKRILSFSMVLGIGFLLLVSLIVSAALSAIGNFLSDSLPGWAFLWQLFNFLISLGVITLLFALIFKILPDARIAWGDVWIGAAITALLFVVGKWGIGFYLGNASVGSAYGAAGSLVVVLIWVYYSAQILFFGAEFTQVYAQRYGSRIEPAANAVHMDETTVANEDVTRRQERSQRRNRF